MLSHMVDISDSMVSCLENEGVECRRKKESVAAVLPDDKEAYGGQD